MRVAVLLPAVLIACTPPPAPATPDAAATIDAGDEIDAGTPPEFPPPTTIGPGSRPAKVVSPASYDAKTPLPVVFLLGGYSFTAADADEWLGVTSRVDADDFLLVMPDGTRDSDGEPFWNATDTCCDYDGSGVDDVGYLMGLLDELERRFAVDRSRVTLLGHSAGAFMAFRLACDHAARFSAVASLAGSFWLDPLRCAAARPVSVLHVHGTADDTMPYAGDEDAPGAVVLLERWLTLDACPGPLVEDPAKRDNVVDLRAQETTVSVADGCAERTRVEHWKVAGAGHQPDFRPAFTEAVLRWLLDHPRP